MRMKWNCGKLKHIKLYKAKERHHATQIHVHDSHYTSQCFSGDPCDIFNSKRCYKRVQMGLQ